MKKRAILRGLAAGTTLLFASACEKVVTLDLRDAGPRLVLEGTLADDGQPCTVRASRSTGFGESGAVPAVTGAVVTLSDDAGGLETLAETSPGQYRGRTVRGQAGRRYTLRVAVDGQTYVAAATLPPAVPLTGLRAEKTGIGEAIGVVPEFVDPAGRRNYYRFRQYRNGRLNKLLFVQTDEFTDGKANAAALGGVASGGPGTNEADQLATGDSVRVEMQNLDPGAYEYFRTLSQIQQSNPMVSTTPANPLSNFSGGVLGYFSAYSRRQRSLIIPVL